MKNMILQVSLIILVISLLVTLILLQQCRSSDSPPPEVTPQSERSTPPPQQQQQNIPPPRTVEVSYTQIGILTSNETDKEPIVLPLFGRKIRSDRWQYYTATDKTNMLRIPLRFGNRDCEDVIGCDEIYTGDKLFVEVYQGREFTATIYKVNPPQYFASPY